jgi:16S rRNA (cytosine1402-N4)-methyltransferase
VTLQKQKQKMLTKNQNNNHQPVLLGEVTQYLAPQPGETYLDLTAGYGGHAAAVLAQIKNPTGAVLVDRDQEAVGALRQRFAGSKVEIRQQDFYSASKELQASGRQFDMILADLGASSPHFDNASRGFSFKEAGPLDMRMDQSQPLSAETIINNYSEAKLADLIKRYGEEPKARQIARLIVLNRPIQTTTELANIVAKAWPGHSRQHPATRTFQALRIAVNGELEQLRGSLPIWLELLAPDGRIAIISFHSLEDRLVKQAFLAESGSRYDARLKLLTKHPMTGDKQELVFNPRARSAKLRAAVKINIKKGNH